MTVWNGTWKPDGTGGWHTKSDKDIVDQYNSARIAPVPTQMLKDAIDEVIHLRKENDKLRKALIEIQWKAQDILRPVPFQEEDDEIQS
jgi:hypothetical protein